MNHYLIHLAVLLSGFTLSSVSNAAQPDAVPETHAHEASDELDEPQLFEFKTSGFSFDIEVPFEPVVRETTNSSIYAVTIQRRAVDGLALGTDGLMAFVRFSQTIDPLDEIGTIEELDKATMDDAIRSIRKAFGDKNRLTTAATSMEILGETREGKRIDVGLLENGTSVFVECYTFVSEDGNGIGITLKYLDPIGDEIPIDTLIADQLLSGLEVHPLTPESSYIHSLGGYPIRIPVRSMVQNAKRLNKFVSEATIAYEYGSLRFQMIEFPDGVRGAQVARDQLNGYENALNQQRDQGQLEILWDSHSAVVAGTDGSAVLPGLTHAIRMNDQEFLSTMYTAIDDGIVIVANFSGNIEHADRLSTYADQFFKTGLGFGLEPQHQYRLGIGGTDQCPSIVKVDPYAIDVNDFVLMPEKLCQLTYDFKLPVIGAVDTNLRRVSCFGKVVEHFRNFFAGLRHNLQYPARGKHRVIESEIIVGETDMAAHFPPKERTGLLHFILDQGVPRRCHDRNPAMFYNILKQILRAFDFTHNGGTGISRKDIPRENSQQLVSP